MNPILLRARELLENGDVPEMHRFLGDETRKAGFKKTLENAWAFAKVLTYLEDEWLSVASYSRRRRELVDAGFTKNQVGQIANRLVAGTRAEEGMRYDFVGAGEWPTRLDVCAFMFTLAFEPPTNAAAA